MSLDERIANLIEMGVLKEAARDGPLIGQYLLNAQQLRDDADAAKSTIGRFLLAYDALHALAMAFLTDRGLRTGGEGHRSTALQLAIGELTKDAPFTGAVSVVMVPAQPAPLGAAMMRSFVRSSPAGGSPAA